MKTWHFEWALTESGWVNNYEIRTDDAGRISFAGASSSQSEGGGEQRECESCSGWLIPGFISAHSHAFQYAMAGVAEFLGSEHVEDDFWTWRHAMYQLALSISPDQVRAVAQMLYAEMMRYGITRVVEFHYLHNDLNGSPYHNLAELGEQLVAAADATGIELCLVPVYYRNGDFNQSARADQRRFLSEDPQSYLKLVEATKRAVGRTNRHTWGIGVHSLRAADSEDVKAIYAQHLDRPFHMHIAEQQREVDACLQTLGSRPVEWVLDNLNVGPRLSLVHVTHTSPAELTKLATSGAATILCPSTEGNLGDGFFDFATYYKARGRWTIGTDSQISLNPLEDLRWLDYAQRLRNERRNMLCRTASDDSGEILWRLALEGGRQSFGLAGKAFFAGGEQFSGVVLNPEHQIFVAKPRARLLSCLIFSGDPSCYLGVIGQGQWRVQGGVHQQYDSILRQYRTALNQLITPRI